MPARPLSTLLWATLCATGLVTGLACAGLGPSARLNVYNDGATDVHIEVEDASADLKPGEWTLLRASYDADHEVRATFPDGTVKTDTLSTHRGSDYKSLRVFQAAGEACWAVVDISTLYGHPTRPLQISKVYAGGHLIEHGLPFCENARTDAHKAACAEWGGRGDYILPEQELPKNLSVNLDEDPIAYRLMPVPCDQLEDGEALAALARRAAE